MMYFDGSVMVPSSGDGVVLISSDGSRLCYAIRLHFLASNNATEYEALINELRIAISSKLRGYTSVATQSWSSTKS